MGLYLRSRPQLTLQEESFTKNICLVSVFSKLGVEKMDEQNS
jgi:hypothetical protein